MSVDFKDISGVGQGVYNMDANPDQMVMIKMSGGDETTGPRLYYDSQAARNYNNAIRLGKIPFMYHFYGGGDPITEADFFLKACSPLAEGDGMAIDVEGGSWWNPQTDPLAVAKVTAFINHIHDQTGMWIWKYLNRSTFQMYDWSPTNNSALWIAAPDVSFDADITGIGVYMAQQGPIVDGVDTDRFFGTIDQLKEYGYHNAQPAPVPDPQPTPVPVPTPDPQPPVPTPPVPDPVPQPPAPAPNPDPTPTPAPTPQPTPAQSWVDKLIKWLKEFFGLKG